MMMTNKEWFRQARYGMMIHWGLYSLIAGEWQGKRMPYIGEWAQAYFRIPNAEYSQLAKAFDPIYFSADEWVRLSVDCGIRFYYRVVVAVRRGTDRNPAGIY